MEKVRSGLGGLCIARMTKQKIDFAVETSIREYQEPPEEAMER